MKIIVSSRTLANELSQIDFSVDFIQMAEYHKSVSGDCLVLHSKFNKSISILVESYNESACYSQLQKRWDWLYNILSVIDEQPVTLEIGTEKLKLTFDY